MTTPRNLVPTPDVAVAKLQSIARMVDDALSRVTDNLEDSSLSPTSCAYIDGQLAKMIGWLASARAIVIVQADLEQPHFDGDETIDLDEAMEFAKNAESQGGEGSVPHQ